jgi:hypothetical protein
MMMMIIMIIIIIIIITTIIIITITCWHTSQGKSLPSLGLHIV